MNTDALASNAVITIAITGLGPTSEIPTIRLTSPSNTIRGLAIYNAWRKIWIDGPNARNNLIAGNFVGTNPAATYGETSYVASEDGGLTITAGAHDNLIGEETLAGRNVIAGNQRSGLHMIGDGTLRNIVRNNIIGLAPDGTRRVGNVTHGMDIDQGASQNIVGGTGTLQRNVISGNGTDGIEIVHHTTTVGNQVVGNFIGTDLTGNAAPAYTRNTDHGVHVDDGAQNTIVTDNVIGNARTRGGVEVDGALTAGTVVARNRIGISLNGTAIPNIGPGVGVTFHPVRTTIGPGNIITNGVDGIVIGPEADVDRNTITRNSIYGNSGLGIDILPAGVNPNGYYPATGPNQALPFPVIATASATTVTGRACANCTVEIFAADGGANAFGEGQTFVGSAVASAAGTFTATVSGLAPGGYATATATDANGNSSEFSLNRAVTATGDAAPGLLLARDQFARTLADAWGTASVGGPWSTLAPPADYDVANGAGTMAVSGGGAQHSALLASIAQRDVDITVEVTTDKLATGGTNWAYVIARQSGTNNYQATLRMAANGGVFLQISRVVNNVETAVGAEVPISGLVHTPNQGIWVRMQATGASPTTLRAKAWADGTLEPAAWAVTQTNSEATLQSSGAIGVRSWASASLTNAPIAVSFDELRAYVPVTDDGVAPAAPQNLVATPGNERVALAWNPNAESDIVGYHVYRSTSSPVPTTGTPLSGSGAVTGTTYVDTTAANGTTYFYAITAVDSAARRSAASNEASATPTVAAGTGLLLNGSSQYVTFGVAPALNAQDLTLELWFRRTGTGAGTSTGTGGITNAIPLISKGRADAETPADLNMDYFLGIDASTGRLVADFEDTINGGNHPVTGVTAVTSNVWHHAAAVYDTSTGTWRLYLDGVLDRTLVVGDTFIPEATSVEHAAIGSALTSNGTAAGFFAGAVDEVRIWGTARTPTQIQQGMSQQLIPQPGMLGRWGFEENAGTVVGNSVAGAPDGTTVAGPTWTQGAPFTAPSDSAPAMPVGFSVTAEDLQTLVNWDANAEADLAGYNLYRSTSLPVNTSGTPLNGATPLTGTSYLDVTVQNDTEYFYALTAVDVGGNTSAAAGPLSATPGESVGHAIDLNGSSQYVTFGAAPGLTGQSLTLELWFRRTGTGVGTSTGTGGITNAIPLISKGRADAETPANLNMNYFLGIDASSGVLVADFEDTANGGNHPVSGATAVTSNVWHHAAAVYSTASDTWRLYLDGVLDRTLVLSGDFTPESTSIEHAAIGSALTSNGTAAGFFAGSVDEARIWNVARSTAQVQATRGLEVTSGTGLIGRYGMNEDSGTTVASSVAGAPPGTIVGGATRSAGAPLQLDFTPPAAPVGLSATGGAASIALAWSANTEFDLAGYQVFRSTTLPVGTSGTPFSGPALINGTTFTDTTANHGTTYNYVVVAVDTSNNRSLASTAASAEALTSANNQAVQFNGSTQYVTFGAAPQLNAQNFTLELWFRRTGTGVGVSTGGDGVANAIPLLTKGRSESSVGMNWFLGIDATSGVLVADFEDNATAANHPVAGTTVVTTNVWHHAAAVYDTASDTWQLYLDGVLDRTLALGGNFTPDSASTSHAAIGSALTSTGAAAGFFAGTIDEVRIWNTVRNAGQIQSARDQELTSGTGLLGRYGLNEGQGTTAASSTASAPTGTLQAGATWVNGAPLNGSGGGNAPPAIAPVTPANGATGTATSVALSVTPTDTDTGSLTVTYFGRVSQSGVFTQIGTFPGVAAGSTHTTTWSGLDTGMRYEWYATVSDGATTATSPTRTFNTSPGADPVFVGASDVHADCSTNGTVATGALVAGIQGNVFTVGDNVTGGTATEYNNCYNPNWGPQRTRTRPTPGNHDWQTGNLNAYFAYFGSQAGGTATAPYYSYNIGANWHVIVLDSNCSFVSGGCGAGSPQVSWLVSDLAANSSRNVIAMWHHPRFSSGATSMTTLQAFVDALYAAHADIVLSGHDHVYERQSKISPSGSPDPAGIRFFTLGTGGGPHHSFGTIRSTSQARDNVTWGVTRFVLHPTSFEFRFLPIAGLGFTDSGSFSTDFNNSAPLANVTLTPGTAGTDDTLTATATKSDPDADAVSLTWQWRVNGTLQRTFTSGTALADTFDLSQANNGNPGDTVSVTVTPSDATHTGVAANASLVVAATNHAPVFTTDLGNLSLEEGEDVDLHPAATDADGTTLTYAASGLPSGISINSSTGVVSGTLAGGTVGTYDITLTVSDGLLADADTLVLSVTPGDLPPATPTNLTAIPDDEQVHLTWTANSEPDVVGYNVYRSSALPVTTAGTPLNGATPVAATNYLDISLVNNSEYFYAITAVDAGGHASPLTAAVSATPGAAVGHALDLNGSSQYVTFGAAPALRASSFTLELWFRRTGAGVATTTGGGGIANAIPLITKGRSESGVDMNYFFGIDSATGMLVADFEDTTAADNHPVTGTTAVTSNVWHHAAAVYDTATDTWRLYLDGTLDRTLALGGDFTPGSTSPAHSALGSALTSTGAAAGFFQGAGRRGPDLERRAHHGAGPGDQDARGHLGLRADRPLRVERGQRHVGRLHRRRCSHGHRRRRGELVGRCAGAARLHAAGRPDGPQRHGRERLDRPHLDREHHRHRPRGL